MRNRACRYVAVLGLGLCLVTPLRSVAQDTSGRGAPTCSSWGECNAGASVCTIRDETTSFWPSLAVADYPDGVSSDGQGRYLRGTVQGMASGAASTPRSFAVNLTQPVPGGGARPLGLVTDASTLYAALDRLVDTIVNLHAIPIGGTVPAAQLNVGFHLDGRYHVLQMGPRPLGNCHVSGTLVHGRGTTTGTIYRAGPAHWVVDLPAGSIGRLFDISRTVVHAVDKGLYQTRLHYEIGDDPTQTSALAGRITKAEGGDPLFQAVVTLYLSDGTRVASAITRVDGSYETPHVPLGSYEVRIRARGFSQITVPALTIGAGRVSTYDASMSSALPGASR